MNVDGASVESICQVVKDGARTSALRPSVLRPSALRPSVLRPSVLQPSQTVEFETKDGETVLFNAPARAIGATAVGAESVGAQSAPATSLPYEQLETQPDVDVAQADDTTAYVAPSSVLFDDNKAVLKITARKALRAIVADLNDKSPNGKIAVDGYTDNQGSKASGLTLSTARAEAVARFLTTTGGVARSRIAELNAYGEANPAFPNDSEANTAKNHRVVISVEN